MTAHGLVEAGARRRTLAWLCDAVIGGVVLGLPTFAIAATVGAGAITAAALGTALVALVAAALFDGGDRAATPGKRLVGMRVVDERTGQSIGYSRGAAYEANALNRPVLFDADPLEEARERPRGVLCSLPVDD